MSDTLTQPPLLTLGDFCELHNRDDHTLQFSWNSKPYRVDPGHKIMVPFELVKLYFGDPRSTAAMSSQRDLNGVIHWLPDRASEIRRLRCLYDNQAGDEGSVYGFPKVEIFDINGERVLTVLDDPTGETVTPATRSVSEDNEILGLVRKQQQTIDMLMQRLNLTATGEPIEPDEQDEADADGGLATIPEQVAAAEPFKTADESEFELPEDR